MGAGRGQDETGDHPQTVLVSDAVASKRDRELLERQRELEALETVLVRVRTAHGGVAVVEGPAGIGKTRLLDATRERATGEGMLALRARTSELEFDYPFGVVRQLFEPAVARVDDAESLFAGAAGLARDLVDPTGGGSPAPIEDRFAMLHALYWLTANVAERGPLLLLVDDLQWCDRPSLDFVGYLARRLDDLPVGIVTGLRSAEAGSEEALESIRRAASIEVVRPRPLTETAVHELLRRSFAEPPQEFARACHRATAGNPLLLHELIGALLAAGTKPTRGVAAEVRTIGAQAVSRFVLERLGRLSGEARRLAEAVAVLGERAELEDATRLAELDRAAAADAAGVLVRADLLAPGTPLGFVHPLVRDAVYDSLPAGQRERAHGRAAQMFAETGAPAQRVALHMLHTPPGTVPDAVGVLRGAARRSLAEGAPSAAVSFLRRALAEEPSPPLRGAVLYELGRAALSVDPPAAVEHLGAAVELLDDREERAGARLLLGQALYQAGRSGEAITVLENGLAEVPAVPELQDRYEYELVNALVGTVQVERAVEQVEKLHRQHSSGSRPIGPIGLALLSWLANVRPLSRQEGRAFASSAVADDSLFRAETFDAFITAANILLAVDEYAAAGAALERASAWAVAHGSVSAFAWLSCVRARQLYFLGRLDDAEAEASGALAAAESHRLQAIRPWLASALGDVLIERGRLEEASAIVRSARSTDRGQELFGLLVTDMQLCLDQDRPEEAVLALEELARRYEGRVGGDNPAPLAWRSTGARVLAALGRGEEGRALARREVEFARRWGARRPLGRTLRILGTLESGERGIGVLREAVAVLEDSPARLEHAHALAELGAALRRAGLRAEARDPLRRAVELASASRADPLANRAHDELVAAGARPRRDPIASRSTLTASELRVARLASEGSTNREIAQSLFLSEKTIENHLRSVYRKLDIASRSQLARALPTSAAAV